MALGRYDILTILTLPLSLIPCGFISIGAYLASWIWISIFLSQTVEVLESDFFQISFLSLPLFSRNSYSTHTNSLNRVPPTGASSFPYSSFFFSFLFFWLDNLKFSSNSHTFFSLVSFLDIYSVPLVGLYFFLCPVALWQDPHIWRNSPWLCIRKDLSSQPSYRFWEPLEVSSLDLTNVNSQLEKFCWLIFRSL